MLQFWHDTKHECNDCVRRDELNALVPVGLTISTLTMAPISTAMKSDPISARPNARSRCIGAMK